MSLAVVTQLSHFSQKIFGFCFFSTFLFFSLFREVNSTIFSNIFIFVGGRGTQVSDDEARIDSSCL